ncbi:MAG: fasciclin domain-containing protein [Bacteroidota bacterium]
MSHRFTLLTLLLGLLLVGCDLTDEADPTPTPFQSIAELIVDGQRFSTLEAALTAAGLVEALETGDFTLFAPDDAAFSALVAATGDGTSSILDSLLVTNEDGSLARAEALSDLLTFHVVPGRFEAASLSDGQMLPTLEGGMLEVRIVDGTVYVGGAPVVTTDTPATNGVVHSIGQVLTGTLDIVTFAALSPNFESLVGQLAEAELVDDLQVDGPLTVFAPTEGAVEGTTAFAADEASLTEARQTDVLLYHVVGGQAAEAFDVSGSVMLPTLDGESVTLTAGEEGAVTVNAGVNVIASYTFSNGVVHAIDQVLLGALNITERAVLTPSLSTLVGALVSNELDDDLATDGPFTVFAPSDAAFTAIQTGEAGDFLSKILTYHVVPGEFRAADLSDGQMLTTLNGASIDVAVNADGVFVDGVPVSTANVAVENGVVHLIDTVLLGGLNLVERAIVTPGLDALVGALGTANLVDALLDDGPFTVFAPTDEAFGGIQVGDATDAGLLPTILTYHVVPGNFPAGALEDGDVLNTLAGQQLTVTTNEDGEVFVNGVEVTAANNFVTNGVVHVIDGVLQENLNVVERAIVTPGLDDLVDAVVDTGLADALATTPNITVFAPTDAAFAAAREALGDAFPEGKALADVLLYHVVPAQDGAPVEAGDITDGLMVPTLLDGSMITFGLSDGTVLVNPSADGAQAQVAIPNVRTTNGIVHVISGVLLP